AKEVAAQVLSTDANPLEVVENVLAPAMEEVGRLYEEGEYFIPELVMAGEAMKAAMSVLGPVLVAREQTRSSPGVIVIGTVEGDIHEIGKSLVAMMLEAAGFVVHDLGVDVPAAAFVSKAQEVDADVVGLSALLTTTMRNQQAVIEALTEAGLRDRVKVIVGGAPASPGWAERIGADAYAENAREAVEVVRRLVGAE
ncbi:MAG TPA: dimethylamine corrinoid protein 3, partial [Anaerolineae bacterium]|nr:dimethylamine corrinoid protein 3 [Anaerolineae bacterium]